MDDLGAGALDPDELMDLEEAEASEDIDEDEDEPINDDALPSPLQLPSSGPASAATSAASSPPTNDDGPPVFFTGKPLSIKRGRGRPRREGGKASRRTTGSRIRRWKPSGGGGSRQPKRARAFDGLAFDFSMLNASPGDDLMLDPETGALVLSERSDKPSAPTPEELPYAPESWPGKVCGFCNLGERSQLGQGEMLRLTCPDGFRPERRSTEQSPSRPSSAQHQHEAAGGGDKSPRGPVTCRRQKSFNKCRNPSMTSEYVDELTVIGHVDQPDVGVLFEQSGHYFVHRTCAYWADGVIRNENMGLDNVGPSLLQSSSRKCSYCNHYGASVSCKTGGCTKVYHLPCATASGAFQELSTCILYCTSHLSQVAMHCEGSVCYTCKILGDIANLMYCSTCGEHYHGTCVGLAQLPGVRAGWQCRKCRVCQVCRMSGDETKLMSCEQCDKVYHAMCQRPVVTSIPKYGWKCRCCRVCGDCGSRTPGAGLSSRWHAHYTVCDSCYQQRNKGFNCPLCHRAYRAHAHREMVQCTLCRKFVHGTCDADADLITYHQRKEAHPEYEYVCLMCKNLTQQGRQMVSKRNSIDEDSLSASQESLYDDTSEFDYPYEESIRSVGLGKGKPYACKIAKKRLGYGSGFSGRPKGIGKGMPGKVGFMKRQKVNEFGRKRGSKYKMRGIFGVPGVGLQRPTSDGSKDEEPGIENRLVLCSAKDKYVLTQDICVMCGAIGTDQEGCLISCVQCGQCYHPYCVNVKVTKVILQKGWRCLDCTVCEGCGHRDDESRLLLCDDCDISFHIYCMDPPLHYVPQGTWKCKWCAMCQSCGATDPGFNCNWMNSFSECGPCASHSTCPSCLDSYVEGDLIIQCVQCERWLHGACDSIKSEGDAEKCAEDGYNCVLCRPRDVPPPHLLPTPSIKPPTPTRSPEMKSNTNYYLDGVFLSESGHNHIKSLCYEQTMPRKKRKKLGGIVPHDKEAGIMATIESVIAGSSSIDNSLEDAKLELVDVKDEPQEIYKEGMTWTKEDGPPPEGFTIFTTETGHSVLRRKRQRNLQKLGIGGFVVRVRGIRSGQDNDDVDQLPGQTTPTDPLGPPDVARLMAAAGSEAGGDKPRRKPIRRKPKSKLSETFPAYLQEAFFGKELMDSHRDLGSSSSDDERTATEKDKTIHLSQDEIKAVAAVTAKQERVVPQSSAESKTGTSKAAAGRSSVAPLVPKEEDESDTEALKDVLTLPRELLDTDLVNTLINEDDDELTKNADTLERLGADDPDISDANTKDTKDELSDILGSHFNLDIPNINSKDVEDIFKGVLTDESQESQESNIFPMGASNMYSNNVGQQQQPPQQQQQPPTPVQHPPAVRPTTLPAVNQNNLNSPMSFPPQSPYHSEYSNSPQFSPAFSTGPPSPWVSVSEQSTGDPDATGAGASSVPSTYNQRSSEKMKADEGLGSGATISAVLYANMNHAEWKTEFPVWSDRYKQIIKKWRTLSNEQKAPYLQQAKDNRSALRMKKQQQISKENSASPVAPPPPPTAAIKAASTTVAAPQPSPVQSAPPPQPVSEDQEKIAQQQKTAREAEQERQWKQLQALRQQQAQQQQHVIQEQRVQGTGTIVRVQRQLSEGGQPFLQEAGGSGNGGQEIQSAPALGHTVHDFVPQSPAPPVQRQLPADPYAQQPATPRPNVMSGRPNVQGFPVRPTDGPEMHPQLRDLLQRQQFKKLDEQLLPGKGQQRVWPPNEAGPACDTDPQQQTVPQQQQQPQQQPQQIVSPATSGDATFRHPLPPGIVRQRLSAPIGGILRQPMSGIRMQLDPRMQGLDPRMRLILQQQQQQRGVLPPQLQQQFQQQQQQPPRFQQLQQPVRPSTAAEIDQILQRANVPPFQPRPDHIVGPRMPLVQQAAPPPPPQQQRAVMQAPPPPPAPAHHPPAAESGEQEIPDNVTAELEKLEQEGSIAELQGVGDILGGLGDDDDELLAEMGPDFNILEYADPELEVLTGGEKTNILDSLDLMEPEKDDKKEKGNVKSQAPVTSKPQQTQSMPETPTHQLPATSTALHPPPLVVTQSQAVQHQPPPPQPGTPLTPQQQIHQQMLQQVQQVAAMGRPMPPGTRLMSQDGIIGTVTSNNNVALTFPQNYQQRLAMQQLQNQKMQMRLGGINPNQRMASPGVLHAGPMPPRMPVAAPPPPPPPYPGPPPPYPGSTNQQEQPLLLEDLLEQEKREQEKQLQNHSAPSTPEVSSAGSGPGSALLSEHDFERLLKTDLISNTGPLLSNSTTQGVPAQGILPVGGQQRPPGFVPQSPSSSTGAASVPPPQWQQQSPRPPSAPTPQPPPQEVVPRVPTFQANLLPTPPLPPDQIVTEQDKQAQVVYEQWLNHQNMVLTQQLKFFETEVQKLRKIRKSLNSKQRQLKKSGNQLGEADAHELKKISAENTILQKHLETSRKQSRQHGMLIQDYRSKQQAKQGGQMIGQHSPLGPPASSPIHHPPQSPMMMSPSASPMMQHGSPLHSPVPSVSHSPGPGSVSSVLQSPGNAINQVMSPMQPSPRIGTPQSQSEGSPGPVQSPSMHLPPPMRMTSPQHRRVVTSPIGYTGEMRPGTPQARFARPPLERTRLQSPSPSFQSKPGTPSPLNSPPPINQQLLQRHLQQQAFIQQNNEGEGLMSSQRTLQLIQQRQLLRQQQAANQPQPLTPQQHQLMIQQQQQLAKQQQQQIAQLQAQQRLQQQQQQPPSSPMPQQQQQIMSPHSHQPPSPMPPRSPMVQFSGGQPLNSPMPNSPALHQSHPPSSPMGHQPPSPMMPRSPMIAPIQSPMGMRRPPSTSSSPASMHDRPKSVENPRTPYGILDSGMCEGGGNPHDPNNPIPAPPSPTPTVPSFGRFGYIKLGLRGGAPMWGGFGRGAKRVPDPKDDKVNSGGGDAVPQTPPKFKKESHLSRVTILKKKSPTKIATAGFQRLGSLVSTDYNEMDDSSSTPPVTPPPVASTSRVLHKGFGKRVQDLEHKEQVMVVETNSTGKQIEVEEIMDYDDDNEGALVSEVSLNSAAQQQNDGDDNIVIQTFSQHDLTDGLSSPLESDQIPEEFLLFDIAENAQYSDKEDDDDGVYDKDMQIVSIRSPTTSDEEEQMLMRGLTSDHHLLTVTDTPDSPEQEEVAMEPSEDEHYENSQIVIIDTKSTEEQISTKEDFEELIDEGAKNDKLVKQDTKQINEIHKYAANIFKSSPNIIQTVVGSNVVSLKGAPQKMTLITGPLVANNISKSNMGAKANIIVPLKTAVSSRNNMIGVSKLVTSVSPAITIVSASTSQIASILPSRFTVPVISASAISKLPNVKVLDKPSSSISLTAHQDTCLPKKIFEDDSVSPDSSNNEEEKKVETPDSKKEDKADSTPTTTREKSPVVVHTTPELKMTAQVVQESQAGVQMARAVEAMPFIMESTEGHTDDTKSVVISIPSPTPSQEQMLDNIALQALENRRRDGNGIAGEFESFEDVLDMIENITGDTATALEDIKPEPMKESSPPPPQQTPAKIETPVTVSTSSRPAIMPQLSPLSQPTDLTTNMANVSQQLRTLLSNLHTTATTTTSNVETLTKSAVVKEKPTVVVTTATSVVTSRVIQQQQQQSVERSSPNSSTVIVPNLKKSEAHPTLSSLLPGKLMPDHPKLPTATKKSPVVQQRKPSLSLNAMLQSHPAATVPQTSPGIITTASLLGSPISITRPSLASLAQAQPVVSSPLQTSNAPTSAASTIMHTRTNLLHTQLTKTQVRVKPNDEDKKEPVDDFVLENSVIMSAKLRAEDSQNVLLKQLLQNTACATTQSPTTTTPPQTAPSLPIVPNLEAQLARPVPSIPTSLLPPILQNDSAPQPTSQQQPIKAQRPTVMSRETSFVSKPVQPPVTAQQLHIDVKKGLPPSRTPSRDDLLSPATPRSSCSQDSTSLQTPPLVIKKEHPPQQSPILTPQEVKREFVDESSQHSEVSDHSKSEMQIKEEMDCLDTDKLIDKEELKKMKRRAYQQKRRQNQILNKEQGGGAPGQPKKRPRKSSKVDEDYDSYIESVLGQLRALPPMIVSEPSLNKNFAVVPIYGSGELSKLGGKDYDARCGDLVGRYGNAVVPGFADFYSSKPYGDAEPLPEKPAASTQRGFYDQEFPLIRFDTDEDRKFDLFLRDDTPDSVISSSSPECPLNEPPLKFPGLKLIDEDEDEDDEVRTNMRLSPVVPLIAPIPIRLKPAGPYLKDYADVDKENICKDFVSHKSKFAPTPTTPLKDSGNVTVTLTLTSSAAEDIMGVLRDLANILHIPAPTSYQIVERTSTPPSQKLGLYRTKGKDGKEGAPIDIQSILNGAAKFCRHCDVVILNNMIRKKVSELPFLAKDSELLSDGDELYFCSSTCYMQFALMHRSPSLSEDKAAAIIDHLSQKEKADDHRKKSIFDKHAEKYRLEEKRKPLDYEKMDVDYPVKQEIKVERLLIDQHPKSHKNLKYKTFSSANCSSLLNKYKKPTDKEMMELMYRLRVTVMPAKIPEDTRKCMFCHGIGDSVADGPARLLNFDVDKWVHLNCGLWSDSVYETVNGALMNLSNALQASLVSTCVLCNQLGATIRCFKARCSNIYHLPCAVKDKCVFYKNKTTYCGIHVPKNEKDNELTTLSVSRRVYVDRDENRQVAAVMHHSDQNNLLRVGSLIFLSVGQLLPHQLANFHSSNYIYPIGYKIVRFYWSMRRVNKRCCYVCSIHEVGGRPEFRIAVQEPAEDDLELRDSSCKAVWSKILEAIASMRRENQCVQLFPQFVSGEDLFGLTEPAVVRVLESLPGIETLTDYKFKYGRNPLLELPLAINPSGAARTEPKLRNQLHWKRPHTQRTGGSSARPVFVPASATTSAEASCPYSKQFVHSKSSQYKKMKQEWRNNVYLARSKIQGLGLYAARDLEKHTMVIEYIGEIIRTELAETREKKYEAKNRGIYMFRLDEERVVDATLCGGLARYINHSCNPNCVAEIVEVDRDLRIIIFAKRRIQRGEELAYDYKFDIEDDQNKISCMCGAPNCKKWMN